MSEEIYDDEMEELLRSLPMSAPSPAVRDRVMNACYRERDTLLSAQRRKSLARRWGFITAVALLLMVNAMEENRSSARITALMETPRSVTDLKAPPTLYLVRERSEMMAAMLQTSPPNDSKSSPNAEQPQ
jgi:hypothetical protein